MPIIGTGVLKPSCDLACRFWFNCVEPHSPGVDPLLFKLNILANYESEFILGKNLLVVIPFAESIYV